MPILQLD